MIFVFPCISANAYGNTALHAAVHAVSLQCVKLLLEAGADVHAVNHKGSTPLHFIGYCAEDGEDVDEILIQIGRSLIAAGASVHARDAQGLTPLLACCTTGRSARTSITSY